MKLLLLGMALTSPVIWALPAFTDVKMHYERSDASLLDRHEKLLNERRVNAKGRTLDWVPLDQISPAVVSMILFSEDKRFYEHGGVDWKAVGSAILSGLTRKGWRGASTITMQLASLLEKDLRAQGTKRSLWQKWRQLREARNVEAAWTKPQILEAYLNLVTFRGELRGIGAASRGLFDKEPHGLNETEACLLASLLKSPNATAADVSQRACALASAKNLGVSCETLGQATSELLARPYFIRPQVTLAPHVASQLLPSCKKNEPCGTASKVSTLDRRVQKFALEELRHQLLTLSAQNVQDGAVLVVDNASGEVLAYVGNAGSASSAPHVDGVRARRQAGSLLKPFLYGLAFEKRLLTPASELEDGPLDVPVAGGVYRPENYDNHFHGRVTVRTALASSLNVPAVRALLMVGTSPFVERLSALGFGELQSPDYYGPSLALGSADFTLWELVNAFRTLARAGEYSELTLVPRANPRPSSQVYRPEAAFLVSQILSDRASRQLTFGLENTLSTRFWTAVKTGTSKDMRDNWCVGYSEKYTVGVWVGNFSGLPTWSLSGVTGAAPLWLEIMSLLHESIPSRAPSPPKGVVARRSPSRSTEWYLRGTEPSELKEIEVTRHRPTRISYPASETLFALDPDIPGDQQRIFFETTTPEANLTWLLDGKKVGSTVRPFLWNPEPGRHTLALLGKKAQILDSVAFEVRGRLADSMVELENE